MILKAPPEEKYKELALKIDNIIKEAPNWSAGDPEPKITVSEEFIKVFPKTPRR